MQQSRPSAADYGRSLQGFGVNLIITDLERAIAFVTGIMQATVSFRTDAFAAIEIAGHKLMLHTIPTYRGNELHATLAADPPRGVGIELRCYEVDPDKAEARARAQGFTVLAGSIDKPHGLRECMILDDDGYVWIPSCRLKPDASA